ncbi:MAG: hypothetical protein EB051_01590 [Chlamydiia bacterium]|nr:hypothetical protein [Chlamydiia bacterium]
MSQINPLYATAKEFTPIFQSPDLNRIFQGDRLPLQKNLLKELEMIAFQGSIFQILDQEKFIAKIVFEEYPSIKPLYTDIRFLTLHGSAPLVRQKTCPPLVTILETMKGLQGRPYLWGGNCDGVDKMLMWYPPSLPLSAIDPLHQYTWSLQGFDCSGLLYFASGGITPRNTSELIHFGTSVPISNLPYREWDLKPCDLIVWKGHVIIVVDRHFVIESLGGVGVILSPLNEKIEYIHRDLKRKPMDEWNAQTDVPEENRYVIRRWPVYSG